MSSLQDTPRSERLHIGLFGKRNSGKSALLNALTNQEVAVVSSVAGTTTDPVYKSMELHGIGPCVFIDTAGFDDEGKLGNLRIEQTLRAVERTDIALIVCTDSNIEQEIQWSNRLKDKKIPIIWILNKSDILENAEAEMLAIEQKTEQIRHSGKRRSGNACNRAEDRPSSFAGQCQIETRYRANPSEHSGQDAG